MGEVRSVEPVYFELRKGRASGSQVLFTSQEEVVGHDQVGRLFANDPIYKMAADKTSPSQHHDG
jgi:hypothetical protein